MEATATRVEPDPWMAGVFGHDVYRVTPGHSMADMSVVREHVRARPGGPAFYYAKVPTTRVDQVRSLGAVGFSIVDVAVTFERAPGGRVPESATSLLVRPAHAEDRDEVLRIAESCFVYSRFHLDPLVSPAIANAIKREWARNYLLGRRGEGALVACNGEQVVGFLLVLGATDASRRVRVIDLLGVDRACQGQGVGKALVAAFVRCCPQDCALLRVGTQAANVPSIRLYEGAGFRLAASAYVLHAHVNAKESPS